MKGLFIPEITAEMFRNACLESIESLMAEGEIYDIDYPYPIEQEPKTDVLEQIRAEIKMDGSKDTHKKCEDYQSLEQEPCDCFTCKYGEWKRRGWDITMADDNCGGCCSWNDKYEPLESEGE